VATIAAHKTQIQEYPLRESTLLGEKLKKSDFGVFPPEIPKYGPIGVKFGRV